MIRRILCACFLASLIGSACSDDSEGTPTVPTDPPDVVSSQETTTGPPVEDVVESDPDLGATEVEAEDIDPDAISCTPQELRCAGPLSQEQCNEAGDQWVESPCPEDHGCLDGEAGLAACEDGATSCCVPHSCVPGVSRGECIDAISYEKCNDSGTEWEVEICDNATKCYLGTCIESYCTPGVRICKSPTLVQECDAEGEAWVDAEVCPKGGICQNGTCLSPCVVSLKDGSYLGCEYWAVDLDNIEESEFAPMGIVVSVPSVFAGTDVKISDTHANSQLTPNQLGVEETYVESGQVKVFVLPADRDIDGSIKTTKTFKIETTSPVAVHQFNPLNGDGVFTNDASLLLPSLVTGQSYIVMSWPHRSDDIATLRGFATVIATQPGFTEIRVTPSAPVAAGQGISALSPGIPYLFVLAQGEALNFETDGEQGVDLTGTLIEADQKVSVISGHECANVPLGITACDHMEQQLFPVETWGTSYVADTFAKRSPTQTDIWRVIAGDNDVTVTTTPPVPGYGEFVLQRGQWLQFASPDSFQITADGPIMVGHYLTGANYPGAIDVQACEETAVGKPEPLGDPAFTLAAPVTRYLSEYAVLTPAGYIQNYLNVIGVPGTVIDMETCDIATQVCNTAPISEPFVAIEGTDYGVATVPVTPGIHRLVSTNGELFGLTAYGYDCDVSYAYPGGLKLQGISED